MSTKQFFEQPRHPVKYINGAPVDQTAFFEMVTQFDGELQEGMKNYLEAPGIELSDIKEGQTLVITGRNPSEQADWNEPDYFDQTMILWRDRGELFGQFVQAPILKGEESIAGRFALSASGNASSEEFTIDAIHSSIDPEDSLSESGPQRIKIGYYLQAEGLRFPDGVVTPHLTLAGKIVSSKLFELA